MRSTATDARRPTAKRLSRTLVAAAAILGLTALPAAATVLMQNFVEADIESTPACMTKTAGSDSTSSGGVVTFNTTNTQSTSGDSVNLLNETFTLKGFKGDRLISSDAGAVVNKCTFPVTISLKAEAQFGEPAWAGDWADLAASVYLGTPGGAADPDFTNTSAWLGSPIHANSTGVTDDSVGTVTLPAGSQARIGWSLDSGTRAAATNASPAILRFTVSGSPA
ncbi:MAG: hypothetical protein ACK5O2_09445 [Microthrixaceae bacterium]